ncbi:hypothetical protein EYS14_22655 [Alteromonadaceae bacterium M269]|nr:hypothetical protein EYS14_22655 [Alteromonadaceae bacterium M269]
MKRLILSIGVTLLASMSSYTVQAQQELTRVDKINYCRTIWPLCNDRLQGDYHWWEDHGVPDQIQKNTYISRYNEPERNNVEHLVFIASGQRSGGISQNLLTGQRDTRDFRKQESNRTLEVARNSLGSRLTHALIGDSLIITKMTLLMLTLIGSKVKLWLVTYARFIWQVTAEEEHWY